MNDFAPQGSEAWRQARLGRATASRISDIMAKGKNGDVSASRANYMAELVAERLTGVPYEGFKSAAMERGNEVESRARAAYSMRIGQTIEEVGFIPHPRIEWSGSSPDGLIGANGGCEFKIPNTFTHIKFLQTRRIETAYIRQIQFNMACTGRLWWDFVSFDPRLPDHLAIATERLPRDTVAIAEIEAEVRKFLAETDAMLASLRAMEPA